MGRNMRHMRSTALPTSTMAVNRVNSSKSSEYEKWIVETGVGVVLYTASSRSYWQNKTLNTKYAIWRCGTAHRGVFWWATLTIAWVWEACSASAILLTTGCSNLIWYALLVLSSSWARGGLVKNKSSASTVSHATLVPHLAPGSELF
jgi:hypothetical protein